MRLLNGRLGAWLGGIAAVALATGALLDAAPAPVEGPHALEIVTGISIGAIAVAVAAAWWAMRLQGRRVQRIGTAIAAWEQVGGRAPLQLIESGDDDELASLAERIELIAARAAAQSARLAAGEREREELLGNVAHDLRTPLASMQGYLELVLVRDGAALGVESRNDLNTAVRQGERLGRLLGDLLELAHLGAHDATPPREPFALAELMHDTAQRFMADAASRGVHLDVRIDEKEAGRLRVDAQLAGVERVLAVLLENALRHTPAGGNVSMHAHVERERAVVAVADDGDGIACADLAELFEHYRLAPRVGAPDRAGGHGGLGLAIARRIVERHGGRLDVESAAGRGTRFAFDLPLAAPATARDVAGASPPHPEEAA